MTQRHRKHHIDKTSLKWANGEYWMNLSLFVYLLFKEHQ